MSGKVVYSPIASLQVDMHELTGGRQAAVFREQDKVYRPLAIWSTSVHQLLDFLQQNGFDGAPRFLAIDNNSEVLTFIEGDTYNYPLSGNIASEQALKSAAKLLRRYHDISCNFLTAHGHRKNRWMLPPRQPEEVVCHGDFAPYNVVLNGSCTVAVIDFDTAHPAPRLWDVAYAVYCWAPFKSKADDKLGDIISQSQRAKLFCDAYGLSCKQRQQLLPEMLKRIKSLVDFILDQAEQGEQVFIDNINDRHHLDYLADIDYVDRYKKQIMMTLLQDY